jgi:hypothetical protein
MRKLALALALSTALFAADNAAITSKQAPKSDGVVTKKSDNVKLDKNAMYLSPAHVRAMKRATLYKVIVKPLENTSDNTTFLVKDYYTAPFEEYVEYDDLIDRLNKIIDKKIMICQAEHKVTMFDSTVTEVNYKNYDDLSCLISPLEERLDKGKRKAIKVKNSDIEDSPIQVDEQIVEMAKKELKTVEPMQTPMKKVEKKKAEEAPVEVNDNEPVKPSKAEGKKEKVAPTTPPSATKSATDNNGMGEYPEEATKNQDRE